MTVDARWSLNGIPDRLDAGSADKALDTDTSGTKVLKQKSDHERRVLNQIESHALRDQTSRIEGLSLEHDMRIVETVFSIQHPSVRISA